MNEQDASLLAGRDDALFRTLGLLIRQLHVKGIIDAPDLTREMHLLAGQLDNTIPQMQQSASGMAAMAATIAASLPAWTEARLVTALYQGQADKDPSGH